MQVASFNSSTAFPPSPHSAYSNSPNTPHGFGHASPAVASPALDSRMIQQGSYISSYGHAQSYGTPVTAQFPVPGGCTPHEQPQQHGFYAGPNASPASHHGAFHRKSSSAGSSASLSDALGLYPHAAYGSMAANDASGVTHSPTMFGSPRFAEPQADHLVRRPSTGPRRSSLGFSPKLARSPFQLPSNTLVSSSPRATMTSPSSDHVVIPPGQSPHIQNYALLPQGVRTDGISTGSPSHSPRISFSAPTSPPAITPPSGVGLGLTSPRPHSITIARPKALRKPKKQLPVPEPGLVKASRGRAVPTQVELLDSGVWDGDITAAHNKARIRERVKMRQSARAAVQGDGAPATPADGNASGGSVVTRDAAWDGRDRGDGDAAGGDADREGSLASNAGQAWSGGEGYSLSASPELASLGAAQGHEAMPTVHVVSPRSYVCPVPSCSKAFKRREHLRCVVLRARLVHAQLNLLPGVICGPFTRTINRTSARIQAARRASAARTICGRYVNVVAQKQQLTKHLSLLFFFARTVHRFDRRSLPLRRRCITVAGSRLHPRLPADCIPMTYSTSRRTRRLVAGIVVRGPILPS